MTCARCEDLEEQVAYWKSEASAVFDETLFHALRERYGLTWMEGKVLTVLSKGRSLRSHQLAELCDAKSAGSIDVFICRLRKKLSKDSILTIWGRGYTIGDAGKEAIKAAREMAA